MKRHIKEQQKVVIKGLNQKRQKNLEAKQQGSKVTTQKYGEG